MIGTALIPRPAPASLPPTRLLRFFDRFRFAWGTASARHAKLPSLAVAFDLLVAESDDAAAVPLAHQLLRAYAGAEPEEKIAFFESFVALVPDTDKLRQAALGFVRDPTSGAVRSALQATAESPRLALIRRLNQAHGGTAALVEMRAALLDALPHHPALSDLDADFQHVFSSWFNRGFLDLRRIGWSTEASILQKLIEHEAVHAIKDWDDLRRRLEPPDRRCFAFFHPRIEGEPLIFVEVALMRKMPAAIEEILASDKTDIAPEDANTAVFYSISSCQKGLKGIAFGNHLIKQAVAELSKELPNLKYFCTLSPVPGFSAWMRGAAGGLHALAGRDIRTKAAIDTIFADPDQIPTVDVCQALSKPLAQAAARYLLTAKGKSGLPLDAVARFHLGNGARLDRINVTADLSERGRRESFGVMVNYVYDLETIDQNRTAFAQAKEVAVSRRVAALAESA